MTRLKYMLYQNLGKAFFFVKEKGLLDAWNRSIAQSSQLRYFLIPDSLVADNNSYTDYSLFIFMKKQQSLCHESNSYT